MLLASSLMDMNRSLFELINSGMANPVFDFIMPFLRLPVIWVPLYVFFATFFIINFKKEAIYIFVFAAVTIFFTDQLNSHVLKSIFQQPRPCADVIMGPHLRLLVDCGSGFSFPSTHAINHFAFAFFLIGLIGKKVRFLTPLMILWAFSVCFAQVYVGVHFPLDVITGGLLGTLIGYWSGYFCKKTVFEISPEGL